MIIKFFIIKYFFQTDHLMLSFLKTKEDKCESLRIKKISDDSKTSVHHRCHSATKALVDREIKASGTRPKERRRSPGFQR